MRRRILSLLLVFALVLGMLPVSASAADAPFTVTVDGAEITAITESTLSWNDLTCYTVMVPEGTAEVKLQFDEDMQCCYYTAEGDFLGYLSGYEMITSNTHTVAVQDKYGPPDANWDTSTPDGVLDGLSVQYPDNWSAAYFIQFAYGSGESSEPEASDPEGSQPAGASDPFLNIKIGGVELAKDNITYKGIFKMGDYMADEEQETTDFYDYVHQVPYYHVTVPCGTASVNVTYSAETNILVDEGSNTARGYVTDLEVDAVSSPTVRGVVFENGYTRNDDGTQTVKTPVTGYTFNAEGKGRAITLEENGGAFAAVCLFSFAYDGKDHVYDSGKVTTQPGCESEGVKTFTCSCGDSYTETVAAIDHSYADGTCANCGEADPDYVAPGAVQIPEGAPFTALTTDAGDVTAITQMDDADYNGAPVPYYQIQIPASATKVYVTHPEEEDPFCDASYGSAYGYAADTENWGTSGISMTFEEVDGGYKIELPLSTMVDTDMDWNPDTEGSFVADEDGYVGYAVAVERSDVGNYTPICFFTFAYAAPEAGEHIHSYDEGVVTKAPTCTEKGEKTFTCSGCQEGTDGHSYTEEIPANGHKYGDWVETIPATCVADGQKVRTCTNGCVEGTTGHTETATIGKLGHKYGEGVETAAPTCTENGVMTYTCSRCAESVEGHTRTEPIPNLGHDYQEGVCSRCQEECPQQDENGVYQIGSEKQLLWFADAVSGGATGISAALTADITLDSSWPGIGTTGSKFAGSFDGRNHTVTLSGSDWGLFGYTMGTYDTNGNAKQVAVVKNVVLEGTVKKSALIHEAGYTHISSCINKADVTSSGNSYVAGIVGKVIGYSKAGALYTDVLIENCGNEGDIDAGSYVGGILGYAQSNTRLRSCYNTGDISGTNQLGGMAGYLQEYKGTCEIVSCYNRGSVSGSRNVGGICGQSYSNITIADCYNAGACVYGITGNLYNKTITISNCYFQGTKSDRGVPENTYGTTAIAVTAAELCSADFAVRLSEAFQQSCPAPTLTWQEAQDHTGMEDDGICDECGLGSDVKESYKVIFPVGEGYTVSGEETATHGESYTFSVILDEGYRRQKTFAVKVNGTVVEENTENAGTFTYEDVQGPLTILVEGVEKTPDFFTVSLPNGEGKGYRVTAVDGTDTVPYGGDYQFRVTMHENFREGKNFQVLVNGSEAVTADENGICTLTNVLEDKTITVIGVEAKPYGERASITMNITKGENAIYETPQTGTDQMMLLVEMDVPYFDISLYGLNYYYNPDCYRLDEAGKRLPHVAGNPEISYGKITVLHAFIYATEVYYLGLDPELAGTGLTYRDGSFQKAIHWTEGGTVGSIFMKLWDHGTNLNYYVNYEYPLGLPGWGSTSDQILLHDGDVITAHMIASGETDDNGDYVQGSDGANGSAYGIFVVDDNNTTFDYGTDTIHRYTVAQGEEVKLSLYSSMATSNYSTDYTRLPNQQLYWIHDDDLVANMNAWNAGVGMVTDANGDYVLDTSDFEPGIYYIGARGGFTKGDGKPDAGGFVSNGYERGPAVLVLIVTEGEDSGEQAPEYALGDVNGDGYITADDAAAAFAASISSEGLTEEQKKAADVNGDGYITADDAALIFTMSKGGVE